jgi:hypothetical protein
MTRLGNGQPVRYNVSMSQQTRAVLKYLHSQAAQGGTASEFLAALRQIIERLRTDPVTFGEPQYRLPALQLLVRQGVVSPLIVEYAVHDEQPIVFIRGFKVLS